MKKQNSIVQMNILISIVILSALTILLVVLILSGERKEYKEEVFMLEAKHTQSKKEMVKGKIDDLVRYINTKREILVLEEKKILEKNAEALKEFSKKINIKNSKKNFQKREEEFYNLSSIFLKRENISYKKTNENCLTFKFYLKEFDKDLYLYLDLEKSEEKLKRELLNEIKKIRYGKEGYIYIHSYNGIRLSYVIEEEIGKNKWGLVNKDGIKLIQELVRIAKQKDGGFFKYYSSVKPSTGKTALKYAFIKGIQDWEWSIGTGVYVDDIQVEIDAKKEHLKKHLIRQAISVIILFLGTISLAILIVGLFSKKIKKEFDIFISFFNKSLTSYDMIKKEELYFEEFKILGESANKMTKRRKKAEDALNANLNFMSTLLKTIPNPYFYKDANGIYIGANELFCEYFGGEISDILGSTDKDLMDEKSYNLHCNYEKNLLEEKSQKEVYEAKIKGVNGNRYVVFYKATFKNQNGSIGGILGILSDINDMKLKEKELLTLNEEIREKNKELKQDKELLREMAIKDGLTKLYNRRYANDALKNEVKKSKRYKKELAVVMLDIDFFKKVNDNFGHQIGDEVLIVVAKVLEDSLRDCDVASRYGGEEFLLILAETDLESAYFVAERIRKSIEALTWKERGLRVTVSSGVAELELGQNEVLIVKKADDNLYKAKENGRNRVEK